MKSKATDVRVLTVLSALDLPNAFKNLQSNIAFFALAVDRFIDLAKHIGWDIFHHVLCVKRKHPYLEGLDSIPKNRVHTFDQKLGGL